MRSRDPQHRRASSPRALAMVSAPVYGGLRAPPVLSIVDSVYGLSRVRTIHIFSKSYKSYTEAPVLVTNSDLAPDLEVCLNI
jgi:hypothetical protein